LFEFTFALLRHGGEVCVLQYGKELAFFHAASALNEKLFNCGGNFRRENGLLQREHDAFGGNDLFDWTLLRGLDLNRNDGRRFLFRCAASQHKRTNEERDCAFGCYQGTRRS